MVTDSRDVIAWGPRLEALDKAFRLKGSYEADNAKTQNVAVGIRVTVEQLGHTTEIAAETGPIVEVMGQPEAN